MNFIVTTGYGYFKDSNGNIIDKYVLKPGEHLIKDGYTFVEVVNQTELNNITVYIPPVIKTPEEIIEEKIKAEIRRIAIANLTASGSI